MDLIVKKTLQALKKNKIEAVFYTKSEEAIKELLNEIKSSDTVGIGGSMTVNELGIIKRLKDNGNKVFFHWLESTPEQVAEARRNAFNADFYLCSTNALTAKGQLVNIDGVGNRVSGMIYAAGKVRVVCGVNKIVEDVDAAIERIKATAYKNAQRLNLKTPCAVTEKCSDCDSPERMCSVTTIINKKPKETDLKVIIIGEELGF